MSVPATFALLLLLLATGKILARFVDVEAGADVLNRLGINLFFPAAILLHAPDLQVGRELAGLVIVPWIVLAAAAAAGAVCVSVFSFSRQQAAVVVLGLALGNTAFLGYAITPALLGPSSLPYAVVYDQLGSFVMLSTVGITVIAVVAGQQRPSVFAIAKKIVTFPPFLALVVGVTLMPAQPPADVDKALSLLAGALLPCMAVAVGLRLRFALPKEQRAPFVVVVVGKLVAVPALALLLVRLLGVPDAIADVAVVQAAMPVMVTLSALLGGARVLPELAASVVAFSTLGAMVTLPLWQRAIG